ncbi:lysylphosphatidylglycerol synthase transmembrane domain-containing protein [Ichthyobacterium seriolicida]|uniref:Dolichol-P-glucose synthetase n=1 Tax=Ichthyobacterium seriolicida TaxID=242600 RepID=A0A1J1ECV0_9FLAO|nr:lysylphosphatidylglycerol synthase transmembrane domain-containing protein [Ichthyobacterium seriolicida]BAV95336.1 hypothetical protein JBKA6_1323 [Ichthyobacterium seriolicida]
MTILNGDKSTIDIIKYLLSISIGFFMFYLVFSDVNFSDMISELKKANLLIVLSSFIMGYLAYISRAKRWCYLSKHMGYDISLMTSTNAISITYITNLILPRAGEIFRCTYINYTDGVPVNKTLGTIFLERTIDLIMIVILAVISLIFKYDLIYHFISKTEFNPEKYYYIIPYSIVIITVISSVLFSFRKLILQTSFFLKIKTFISGIKEGFNVILHLDQKWSFVFHTVFIWLMYYLMTFLMFFSIPSTSHLGMGDGLFILLVGSLGMIIPVPGGIGSFHYIVTIALYSLKIEYNTGLLFATITHSTHTLLAIISGTFAIITLLVSKKKQSDSTI